MHKFAFFTVLGIIFFFLNSSTRALEVQPASAYNIDKSYINQKENYNLANAIYIVPITLEAEIEVPDSDWYEGIFYYQAVKLNQGDFLAHYFLSLIHI